MTKVTSSSALATLTVSSSVLKKDTLLHIIVKLASPLQLTLEETKKGADSVTLQLFNTSILKERNAILRCLAGTGLNHALDHNPLLLLGGHSITAKTSPVSAMAMAGIASWQSIADSFRNNKEEPEFVEKLNTYLANRAFLIPSAQCTLADMDLALALSETEVETKTFPHVSRWMTQVYAVLEDYGSRHGIVIPSVKGHAAPTVTPVFYYGTEAYVPAAATSTTGTAKPTNTTETKTPSSAAGKHQETPGDLTDEQKKAAADKRAKKAAEMAKKAKPQPPPPDTAAAVAQVDISALDIRVGKILKAWHHNEAEKLFCEEVDVGEDKPRMIASGLRPFYTTNDLENRTVVVLCNLKARNLVGFPSHGMVLCASNDDHTQVKFVVPPEHAQVGERITFEGVEMKPPEAENKVAKKKLFENLAPFLKTNGEGQVVWKEFVSNTSAGPLTSELANAHVS
jgi:methionine--tRNA ligase beta chain